MSDTVALVLDNLSFSTNNGVSKMLKVAPHPDYPPEDGRYVRGNDASPVAVAIILNHDVDKIPPEIEILVRTGIESGAALSGTIQTENIGFEKVVCNVVANPNIRYMIVGGPESEGHLTGEALKALIRNGVDEKFGLGKPPHHIHFFTIYRWILLIVSENNSP
jgi:tetrahydromethanopterin S-methyltransferase subunit A